jgi:DNA-binding NtrC family response regulator
MTCPVCLVCDDEMLISLDIETLLEGMGMAVAGPFANGADALVWAATNRPDVAVRDYMLQDGQCLPLISALKQQQVPIVIHSGWPAIEADMPPEICDLPWVAKPMDRNIMLKALAEAAPQIISPERMNGAGAIVRAADSNPSSRNRQEFR